METFPAVQVTQFDKLTPGDLFVYLNERGSCFALKTGDNRGPHNLMVVLGPRFPYEAEESMLLSLGSETVISYGRQYSIVLPDDPDSWFLSGSFRNPVCIAVHDKSVYVCTNGWHSPERFVPYFVEFSTGKLLESRLPNYVAYTNNWELVIPHQGLLARTLLKYTGKERSS